MKLSMHNVCDFHGCMVLLQALTEDWCGCTSFSRGLDGQTGCHGTGPDEQTAEG